MVDTTYIVKRQWVIIRIRKIKNENEKITMTIVQETELNVISCRPTLIT